VNADRLEVGDLLARAHVALAAAVESLEQRQEVAPSRGHPRAPPRPAARGEQAHPVAVPYAFFEEGRHRLLGAIGVKYREVDVVEHNGERAPATVGRLGVGDDPRPWRRGFGTGGGRDCRVYRLEARDRLRLPLVEHGEVLLAEVGDRVSVLVGHHHVDHHQIGPLAEDGRRRRRLRTERRAGGEEKRGDDVSAHGEGSGISAEAR
jgi:hypothetical protein